MFSLPNMFWAPICQKVFYFQSFIIIMVELNNSENIAIAMIEIVIFQIMNSTRLQFINTISKIDFLQVFCDNNE